jgi:hypothetical protein
MTQPAPGLTGTCANCNWINGHDARCPTLSPAYQATARTFQCAHCGAVGPQPTHRADCPLSDRGYVGRHEAPAFPTEPVPSVFDRPDAGTEAARSHARQLLAQYKDSAEGLVPLNPDAWIGRAAAVLAELAR